MKVQTQLTTIAIELDRCKEILDVICVTFIVLHSLYNYITLRNSKMVQGLEGTKRAKASPAGTFAW